jgi:hypothetical protein
VEGLQLTSAYQITAILLLSTIYEPLLKQLISVLGCTLYGTDVCSRFWACTRTHTRGCNTLTDKALQIRGALGHQGGEQVDPGAGSCTPDGASQPLGIGAGLSHDDPARSERERFPVGFCRVDRQRQPALGPREHRILHHRDLSPTHLP